MPYICCLCGFRSDTDQDLCKSCYLHLPKLENNCYGCGLLLKKENESFRCEACETYPPPFDRLCALFRYDPPVRKIVTGLKFGKNLAYGRVLGELLAQNVESWYKNNLPEAIIPVPLHIKRLKQRGFNQSLELLLPFKKQSNIPILYSVCERVKKTKPQSGLSSEKRRANLKHAFKLVKPIPFEHVAIMDDVVTTGSTVKALARLLKESGVAVVDVWCICRA